MQKIKAFGMSAFTLALLVSVLYMLPAAALSFVLSAFAVLVIIGMCVRIFDEHWLWRACYRFLYNLCTWGEPMPKDEVRGVVLGQPTYTKVRRAGWIALAAFFYTVWKLGLTVNLFLQLLLGVLDVPAVLLGFGLGYLFSTHVLGRQKVIADQIDEVGEAMQHLSLSGIAGKAQGLSDRATGSIAKAPLNLWKLVNPDPLKPPVKKTNSTEGSST